MFENFDLVTMLVSTGSSLVLGIIIALLYMYKSSYKRSFVVTLALLPAIVMAVITLVNGNVGTGIAVMGAFSLVRFRSIPGSAKEIGFIFLSMAIGLATGMSYITYAFAFILLVGLFYLLITAIKFGENKFTEKELKITIPENIEYTGLFDDLFSEYLEKSDLNKVKTTNMGSLYQLTYSIQFKNPGKEKEFIDKVRCRNGNLDIICGYNLNTGDTL